MTQPPENLSRRGFLKIMLASALATTAAGVGASAYAFEVEPNWIEIAQRKLTLPRLDPAFDGYRIAQFSDIHMGTWMTQSRLESIVTLIHDQKPDLIVFTGDFVTHGRIDPLADALIPPLRSLKAPDGVLTILGNHDHWTDPDGVREMIHDSGMIDLNNRVRVLERGSAKLTLAGVDDFWERQSDLEGVLRQIPNEGAAILLAHEPDFADLSAASGRFDLQLSGHSHGGQVILPFIGAPILPRYAQKYPNGLYQVNGMMQYTNRGVGMIEPAVRFNCRPEISLFTLRSADK